MSDVIEKISFGTVCSTSKNRSKYGLKAYMPIKLWKYMGEPRFARHHINKEGFLIVTFLKDVGVSGRYGQNKLRKTHLGDGMYWQCVGRFNPIKVRPLSMRRSQCLPVPGVVRHQRDGSCVWEAINAMPAQLLQEAPVSEPAPNGGLPGDKTVASRSLALALAASDIMKWKTTDGIRDITEPQQPAPDRYEQLKAICTMLNAELDKLRGQGDDVRVTIDGGHLAVDVHVMSKFRL